MLKRPLSIVILVALVAPAFPQTTDLRVAMAKCRAVTDSLQRLVCYDNLAKEAGSNAGGATTAPVSPVNVTSTPSEKPAARETASRRCAATTKKGTQCSRMAKAGSAYCWQHGG